jgi:RNA polymerase sigma factor (sigma-70 family)
MANAPSGITGRLVPTENPTAPVGEPTDRQLLRRFTKAGDESAFEMLIQRHGPIVLGVCRRVLGNADGAEDAFQATFLVLVRRAASIQRPELLGNWLYGVAFRIASRARQNAARRAESERQVAYRPRPELLPELARRELRSVLDEEMSRLPEKYRAPLVLCYLEGKTNEEAARQLGWPTGSMSWRLARGRELLRKRLELRDVAYSPMLLTPGLAQQGIASLSAQLAGSTSRAAVAFAAGKTASSTGVSAGAAQLVEETLHTLGLQKLLTWTTAILAVLFALLGGGWAYSAMQPRPTLTPTPAPACHGGER